MQRPCLFLPNPQNSHSSRIARARRLLGLVALGQMDQEAIKQRCTSLLRTTRRHMHLVRQQEQPTHTLSVEVIPTTPRRAARTHLHTLETIRSVFLRPNRFSVPSLLVSTTLLTTSGSKTYTRESSRGSSSSGKDPSRYSSAQTPTPSISSTTLVSSISSGFDFALEPSTLIEMTK